MISTLRSFAPRAARAVAPRSARHLSASSSAPAARALGVAAADDEAGLMAGRIAMAAAAAVGVFFAVDQLQPAACAEKKTIRAMLEEIQDRLTAIERLTGVPVKDAEGSYDWGSPDNVGFARHITAANEEARAAFAEGLAFMLNYNHEQAIAMFMKCLAADPKCAMAWWGIAYGVSSNYNWPPGLGSGHDACEAAKGLINAEGAAYSDLERDMINALGQRHSQEAKEGADPASLNMGNKPELNAAFAAAMEGVYNKYKDNADVGLDVTAVFVEALMNLKPWALWDKKVHIIHPLYILYTPFIRLHYHIHLCTPVIYSVYTIICTNRTSKHPLNTL